MKVYMFEPSGVYAAEHSFAYLQYVLKDLNSKKSTNYSMALGYLRTLNKTSVVLGFTQIQA